MSNSIQIRRYQDGEELPRGKIVYLRFVVKRDRGWVLLLNPHADLVERDKGLELEDCGDLWVLARPA